MTCQLCLKDKALLNRSHIIPNFMYKSMLWNSRKLMSVNTDAVEKNWRYLQSGYSEANLLCAECDNGILGGLERYASNHIYAIPSERSGVSKKSTPEIMK